MDFDVESHLGAVRRSVSSLKRDGQPARAVILSRAYAATVEDLWDAVTNGERIPRWFLPVGGELKPGGRYQLEGNAGGVITACERPSHFALTWEYGEDVSWVEVRLADDGVGSREADTDSHGATFRSTGGRVRSGRDRRGLGAGSAGARGPYHAADRAKAGRSRPLPLHRTARRSSRAAARDGRKRRSQPERSPTSRVRRQGAPPPSTPVNRPSLPDRAWCPLAGRPMLPAVRVRSRGGRVRLTSRTVMSS